MTLSHPVAFENSGEKVGQCLLELGWLFYAAGLVAESAMQKQRLHPALCYDSLKWRYVTWKSVDETALVSIASSSLDVGQFKRRTDGTSARAHPLQAS